jgi:hypothetical protein
VRAVCAHGAGDCDALGLGTAFGFTAGAQSLLRGDNQQNMTLPDLWGCFVGADDDNDRKGYLQVNCVCNKGKTLGVGAVQHASFRRHKNPLKCPVAHLGFLLFWRFCGPHAETPIAYQKRANWYDKAVIPQFTNRNAGISDSAYTNLIVKAFQLAGVPEWQRNMLPKKHIMRKYGSKDAHEGGAERQGVGSHGGWQSCGLYNYSYLSQVDEDCMHHGACTLSYAVLCSSQ